MKPNNWSTKSKQSRGYGWEWERLRAQILERDNYLCQCQHCKAEGRITLATEVHHIKSRAKGGSDHPSNLASMSHACHKRADAEEQGRAYKPRVVIGPDGFPARR